MRPVAGSGEARRSWTEWAFAFLETLTTGRAALLICLLAALAYSNSLGGQFVFDDTEQIVENKDIRSWQNIARGFTSDVWSFRDRSDSLSKPPPLPYYRPIFTAALTVEYHLFGLWPQGWRLASLLLHVLCSVGVFYLILLLSRRRLVALISALLFAVHPVHAESVCWISGMTDPLFSLFFIASFCLYLSYRRDAAGSVGGSARRRDPLTWSLVLFALAMLSKETALSLVLLIFGYELVESSGGWSKRLKLAARRSAFHFAVAVLYFLPRYLALGDLMFSNPQAPARPFSYTLLTLPSVICSYLFHLVWPFGLSVTYQTRFVTTAASAEFIIPAVALFIGVGASVAFRATLGREVLLAVLLIFVPLLPVLLNLGQVSQEEYLVFDHYLYLSVAGWAYLIALALGRFIAWEDSRHAQRERAGSASRALRFGLSGATAALLLAGLTVAAARENRPWADSYSLWSNAARVRPGYWAPHYNVGLELLTTGRSAEARDALLRAAALAPDQPVVFDALGRAHEALGDSAEAVRSYNHAIELDPLIFGSLNNLGTTYFNAGDYPAAERKFAAALQQKPEAVAVRFNLALCYNLEGRYADAITEFERVIAQAPADADAYYYLGVAYEKSGRIADAERVLSRGVSVATSAATSDKISEKLRQLRTPRE